jgi:hypothetical protein
MHSRLKNHAPDEKNFIHFINERSCPLWLKNHLIHEKEEHPLCDGKSMHSMIERLCTPRQKDHAVSVKISVAL